MMLALAAGAASPASDRPWVHPDPGGTRFSDLSHINRSNVAQLQVAWTYSGGTPPDNTPLQCTPILAEGSLYVVTATHRVVALDPQSGKERWAYQAQVSFDRSGHTRTSRGLAFWSDGRLKGKRRLLYGTPDGRILSLNAVSGEPDPDFQTVDLRKELGGRWASAYVGVSAAPTVFEDLVFVGIATGEDAGSPPGDIMAFSVRDGKLRWRFHVLPKNGEAGSESWEKGVAPSIGAAGAWGGYTLDAKRGMLFAATGSVAPDFDGRDRPGNNLFSNCVLALDARTGKRLWHFQTVRHDLWDHDNAAPPVLCHLTRNGKRVEAVAQVTKSGHCFVLDRLTGKPIFGVKEIRTTASSLPGERVALLQPEPVLPPPLCETVFNLDKVTDISPESRTFVLKSLKGLQYGKRYMPPSREGTVVLPGYLGGSPWSGASFDPTTQTLFVNNNNLPGIMSQPANYRFLVDHEGYPGVRPPWGTLTAIDLNTGKFKWRRPLGEYRELTKRGIAPTGTPNLGGTLVTAGGVVFVGATCDQTFRAFDSRTGELLLEAPLPASAFAAPMTYAIDGRQYVVIAAGGGGYAKAFGFDRGPISDRFVCFALPK